MKKIMTMNGWIMVLFLHLWRRQVPEKHTIIWDEVFNK